MIHFPIHTQIRSKPTYRIQYRKSEVVSCTDKQKGNSHNNKNASTFGTNKLSKLAPKRVQQKQYIRKNTKSTRQAAKLKVMSYKSLVSPDSLGNKGKWNECEELLNAIKKHFSVYGSLTIGWRGVFLMVRTAPEGTTTRAGGHQFLVPHATSNFPC